MTNNQIGVPLTLARLPLNTDYAVIEMGMNHTGEMKELSDFVRPHITLITMIGSAHREFFKSEAEIAAAKAEIFIYQDKGGTAVLNKESPFFSYLFEQAQINKMRRIVSFGQSADADFKLIDCQIRDHKTHVKMMWHGLIYTYELGFVGRHFVLNALGVLAVVDAAGASVEQALQVLPNVHPVDGRGAISLGYLPTGDKMTLIDDAYNANPSSVTASICSLGTYQVGRRIAVLGDMLELGKEGIFLHQNLATVLIENKIDKVYTVGSLMKYLYDVLPVTMQGAHTQEAPEMIPILLRELQAGDVVLVKASKGIKLPQIVKALKGEKN